MLLSDLIAPDFVLLDVEAKDWRDAVRKAAVPLMARGKITESYVDDIIAAAQELGPYFVITKGVALPHGMPETGVIEAAMGLCRLAEPVDFGSAANDPVRYVLVFGARDATAHLEALTALTALIGDADFFAVVDGAEDADPIIDYIQGHEAP